MGKVFHRRFFLEGPAGRLEALLWTAAVADPSFVAVVCHPHPLFGGTMHNKVVYHTARTLHHLGAAVLRFNFRGAGQSQGEHAQGIGEQNDVRAALDYLAAEYSGKPILLAGFSFGSWVGLRVGCEDGRVSRLIALGLAVNTVDASYLRQCAKPKLFVQGRNDPFGSREDLEALFGLLPEPKRLVFIEGADHFFVGHLDEVGTAIARWLDPSK
ncbi:MAG TPA: alpha/beta fold hydrolase [Candidatus Acidoferrales bacterium]|nr:alpha/beta fold hydrolase [Candidatus Acidoferrales bacterium]